MAHGQTYQDSTGHVPAIRVHEPFVAPEGSYWQRLPNQHLFDFSGENGSVYVDPVVQVHGGGTKNMEAEVVWDNIRGARFQATIDGIWHLGGELLERQGVADPILGYWAVQNRIPGWGRSKQLITMCREPGDGAAGAMADGLSMEESMHCTLGQATGVHSRPSTRRLRPIYALVLSTER
jgi:hypothetical protein